MSYDRQCSSCGGFCGRGGCKRENVKVNKQREAMQFALETLEDIFGKKKIDVTAINMLREALAKPARKPLTDYQIREIDELVWKELSYEEKTLGQFALKMARAIERAHGIGK